MSLIAIVADGDALDASSECLKALGAILRMHKIISNTPDHFKGLVKECHLLSKSLFRLPSRPYCMNVHVFGCIAI